MYNIDTHITPALGGRKINQIGVVVEDMEKALNSIGTTMGVRTWYRAVPGGEHTVEVRGKEVHCELEFIMGYAGNLQVEVISTSGDPNIYSEHLEKHGPGLHHICYFVSDYDRKVELLTSRGLTIIQSGRIVSKGGTVTRYAYFDGNTPEGIMIELSESRLNGKIPVQMSPLMMKVGQITGDLERVG